MQFKWTTEELNKKSDNEIVHNILAEKINRLNQHPSLRNRLEEIICKITSGQEHGVTQGGTAPRVIIRIEGGNFQGASANTSVDLSILDIDNKNACDPVANKDDLDYYRRLEEEVETLKPIR
jgi:hypothetical protein